MSIKLTGRKKTIGRIIFFLVLVSLFLLLLDRGGFLRSPTLSAKEGFVKASEILENQGRKAVLTKISTGGVSVVHDNTLAPEQEAKGRGDQWRICFYSKENDKFIYFVHTTTERIEEKEEWAHHICLGHKDEINTKRWKIDSEKAVEIAKDKAKKLGKERLIPVSIQLTEEEKNKPVWRVLLKRRFEMKTTPLPMPQS